MLFVSLTERVDNSTCEFVYERLWEITLKMVGRTADMVSDAWAIAAERLNAFGVFADEKRQLPGLPALEQFDANVRAQGYTGGPLGLEELDNPRNGVDFLVFDKKKMSGIDAASSAWDREYRDRWHGIIGDRVADWLSRLNKLQATLQGWLPSSMTIHQRDPIPMSEELMAKFGVPPTLMPSYDILEDAKRVMRVQPKGLWIIGANGRVDLITPRASYILVDNASKSAPDAEWRYYASNNKRVSKPLNQAIFIELLK